MGKGPGAVALANFLAMAAVAVAGAATAVADPGPGAPEPDPAAVAPPAAAPGPVAAAPLAADITPADPGVGEPAPAVACKQFNAALDYAASNYENFAYDTAGGGNTVNYGDPVIRNSNVIGRTALREAASTAMGASMTPGLPGDISAPMQAWSLHATKLLFIMGLRGGGNSLNDAATSMNTDATNAQMACAVASSNA